MGSRTAHPFDEPGTDRVQGLLADDANRILIAPISVTELARRLLAASHDTDEATLVHRDPHFRAIP